MATQILARIYSPACDSQLDVVQPQSRSHLSAVVPRVHTLAISYDAAAYYYAARRSPGGVLEYTLSTEATKSLTAAGAKFGQTPLGNMHGLGNEFFIPIQTFELFNELRQAGQIVVKPR